MTNQEAMEAETGLPEPIAATLRQVIRRARLMIALRGLCVVVAVGVASLLLVMGVDAFVIFLSTWPRWLLTLWAAGITALAAVFFLLRPVARSFTLSGIARQLESRHPELEERISSAVELAGSKEPWEIRGSRSLVNALVRQASQDVLALQPKREVTFRGVRPFLLVTMAALCMLAGLMVLWPRTGPRLLARAVAPFLNLPNVHADQLRVEPGDAVINPGDPLRVTVTVDNPSVDKAHIYTVSGTGARTRREMRPLPEEGTEDDALPRFGATYPPAKRGFKYRVRARDALSRYYRVRVVPQPFVERLDLRYRPPQYSFHEPEVEEDADGSIRAVVGTAMRVVARLSKSVQKAELFIDGQRRSAARGVVETLDDDTATATFQFRLRERREGVWRIVVTDRHGFTNPPAEYPIEVARDSPPSGRIGFPTRTELHCRPSDRVPILFSARDDQGLSSVQLLLEEDGQAVGPRSLSREGELRFELSGRTRLELSRFAGARTVTFRLRATDNLPKDLGGPQEAMSRTFTVNLEEDAQSLLEQMQLSVVEAVRDSLKRILNELKAAGENTRAARKNLKQKRTLTPGAESLVEAVLLHLGNAEGLVTDLKDYASATAYRSLVPKLESVDEHVSAAGEAVEKVPGLRYDQAERRELAGASQKETDAAIALVEEMLQQFERMSEMLQKFWELYDMADRQDELARDRLRMEQGRESWRTEQQWQQAQQELARELAEMLSERALAQAAERSSEDLRDLAGRARQLSDEQNQLRDDLEQLAEPTTEQAAAPESMMDRLLRQQEEAAGQAAEIADRARETAPDQAEAAEDGATHAGRARDSIQRGELPEAAENAHEAASQMSGLAEELHEDVAETPSSATRDIEDAMALARKSRLAGEAGRLAKRQEKLARQMDALTERRPMAALQGQQSLLGEEMAELSEEVSGVADTLSIFPAEPASAAAEEASRRMQEAAEAGSQAEQALQQGETAQALPAQSRAGRSLAQAAESLDGMAKELADSATDGREPASPDAELAEAFQATGQAAESSLAADSLAAADAMQDALSAVAQQADERGLEGLEATAQQRRQALAAQQPDSPFPGRFPSRVPTGMFSTMMEGMGRIGRRRGASPVGMPRELQRMGIDMADWARLPSELRNDILEAADTKGPKEYRELVKQYFREIARRGARSAERNPTEQ